MRTIVRWMALIMLLLGATACAGRPLDEITMESSIKAELGRSGIPGAVVTCPNDIKAWKGSTFTCTAAAKGETVTLQVTQTDDQGHVTFKIAK